MAEGLFQHAVRDRKDFRVLSAGVGAVEGLPPSVHAVRALRELGVDISNVRSRMLTRQLIEEADYIFGMTHSHVDSINLLFPQAVEKTFLLREFDVPPQAVAKAMAQREDCPRCHPGRRIAFRLTILRTPRKVSRRNGRNEDHSICLHR